MAAFGDAEVVRDEMQHQAMLVGLGDEDALRRLELAQAAIEYGSWDRALQYLRGELK
jgi:hypothetical protein